MVPRSSRPFARSIRDLDEAALRSFVADLWRARGRAVRASGGLIVATDAHGEETTLLISRRRRLDRWLGRGERDAAVDRDVDAVVTDRHTAPVRRLAGRLDATVYGPRDLRRMARYAIDREDRRALFDQHLDGPPTLDESTTDGPSGASGRPAPEPAPGRDRPANSATVTAVPTRLRSAVAGTVQSASAKRRPEWLQTLPVLGIVAALVVVFAVGAAGGPGVGTPPDAEASAPTAGADDRSTPRERFEAGATNRDLGRPDGSGSTSDSTPPGLVGGSVTDPYTLARAHREAVDGRSYRFVVTYRRRADGDTVANGRSVVRVARPTEYVVATERNGSLPGHLDAVASDAYADGDRRYVRGEDGVHVESIRLVEEGTRPATADAGRFSAWTARYVGWFLSTNESAVVDRTTRNGTGYYVVVATDHPFDRITNASTTALVDEHGAVRRLRASYDLAGRNSSVVLSIRITELDDVTVEPPAWYRRATGTNESQAVAGT